MAPPKPTQGKDIRSFFTSIASRTKSSPSNDSEATGSSSNSKEAEVGKRKKKPMVLVDSTDSESESPFDTSKKPQKKEVKPSKETVTASSTKTKAKVSIPETPLKPVDIGSVFGNKPIHRSKDIPEKRKRTLVESQSDEDFEATLKQLDEAPANKKSKGLEGAAKVKTPTKSDKDKSSSQKTSPLKEKASPSKNSASSRESAREKEKVTVKKEPVSDKKRSAASDSPSKNTRSSRVEEPSPVKKPKIPKIEEVSPVKPSKKAKTDEPKEKKSPNENRKVDSNKASPTSKDKKIKTEPGSVKETPKKSSIDKDDSIIESPYDPLEKRKQQAENYRKFLSSHKEGAKNPGSKPVPEGAPGCLTGLTIVVTGVLESLQREEAEELVKKYGGKATKSVSKNTSYILAGDDAGPAKLSKAKDLNVAIIDEDEFLKMIATRPAGQGLESPAGKKIATTPRSASQRGASSSKTVKTESIPETSSSTSALATPSKKKSPEPRKIDIKSHSKKLEMVEGNSEPQLPWVEKYKPTSLKQVIGMHGDKSIAKKLLFWLKNWYDNRGKKVARPSPWSTNDDGAYFKAALLSGPPGIGKTTTAHLAAKELGYDLVEMNASDTRSKRLLHEHVTELLSTQSLSSYAHGSSTIEGGRKRVLVMDEVDGMAGNEDRGGVQELIGLIKTSKIPVICICNDRQHPKIRSLANYCYDLKLSKPRIEQIRGAMLSVCFKEGLQIKPEALDEIIMGANQDVRQVLNHLSMLASDKSLTTEKAKLEASKSRKDFKLGPWDVVKKVFSAEEHKGMSIHDKTGLFFQDYSFGPLFVQENYPLVVPNAAKGDKIRTLDLLSRTAHCMSQTDLIEKTIRSQNAWSLLPVEAVFASVVPGQLMEGYISSKIEFPSWLGKNSRQNKMDRLLQELQSHMRLKISGSKRAVNLDYLPHILSAIVSPLKKFGTDGVDRAVHAMEAYDLMREDLDSLLELAQWPNKPDIMTGIDGKVKAAFTRAYNKDAHMTPYAAGQIKKGRSKEASEELYGDEDGEQGDEESEQEDDPTLDAMIKVKKESKKTASTSAAAKKKAAPAAASSTRGRGGGAGSRGGRKKKGAE